MQTMSVATWSEYKTLLTNKVLTIQYYDDGTSYNLFAPEAQTFLWSICLLKGSSDATDFETNYKPTANAPMMINGNPISAPPMTESAVFSALAIRDTSPHNGSSTQNFGYRVKTIIVDNSLNQAVTFQCQGSRDGTSWINIGATWDVAASTVIYQTCETYFPYMRAIATCAVAPASGTVSLWLEKVGV
jgi:hypothetical protein